MAQNLSVGSDVSPEMVMLFCQDILVLMQKAFWYESHPILPSMAFSTTLSNLFQCSVIATGSVWGPAIPIHASCPPELPPFVLRSLSNSTIPYILPHIVDVNGLTTFSYYDVSHQLDFLKHNLSPMLTNNTWAITLAPPHPTLDLDLERGFVALNHNL